MSDRYQHGNNRLCQKTDTPLQVFFFSSDPEMQNGTILSRLVNTIFVQHFAYNLHTAFDVSSHQGTVIIFSTGQKNNIQKNKTAVLGLPNVSIFPQRISVCSTMWRQQTLGLGKGCIADCTVCLSPLLAGFRIQEHTHSGCSWSDLDGRNHS